MRIRAEQKTRLNAVLIIASLIAPNNACLSQHSASIEPVASAGDQPGDPGPLATDISPVLHSRQIRAAMRRVADWQLKRAHAQPLSRGWEYGALDVGLMAASQTLRDSRYSQYVTSVGEKHDWQLERTMYPANDYAVAQAFLEIYRSSHNGEEIEPLRRQLDGDLDLPDDPAKPAWWWCDALFMEPAVGTELSNLTGDPKYAQYIDREWAITEKLLYDPQKHLFSRDASYLGRHEKNGEKIFWSRGNGWVMGGIVRVLATLPPNDPSRNHYVELLQQMSAELASVQGSDGLWRPGLLDADSYPLPEMSGSAFFTYAIAWGINNRLLDRKKYQPVVEKAWRGMLTHIYADGRLGSIQQVGDSPAHFPASSSYVYGVGAFLLAGSELDVMSHHRH
jgi:rhamnogalacturonyl hydrolase YesR